jgi:hypothetical protein
MRSVVQFEQLDVKRVLEQLLGAFARLVPDLGGDDFQLELTIASRLRFDQQSHLQTVATSIAVADMPHVLNLRGEATGDGALNVVVFSGERVPSRAADDALFRQRVDLPRDAVVSDAFAPNSELRNLQVGQTWTIPVYRPFPPNSPVQIVEAKAERLELIYWNRDQVEVMVVAYRGDAGSGIAAARRPTGRVWVRPDGLVLRQEVAVSNLRLVFERLPDDEGAAYAQSLEDEQFLPLLPEPAPAEERPSA